MTAQEFFNMVSRHKTELDGRTKSLGGKIVMAYIVIAHVAMAFIIMAYIVLVDAVMAYMVMA